MTWISVKERLPEAGKDALCITKNGHHLISFIDSENGRWWTSCPVTHWMPLPTFPQPSSLVSQGAESADIGKLDTADKSGHIGCVHSAPVRGCANCMRNFPEPAGSAETGREKAALAPQLCNWMMSKFNPGTGAIYCNEPEGHEGQHRHTFPPQTYPAREPEKLNNAQLDTRRVIPAELRRYSWPELQAMLDGPNKGFLCEECDGRQTVSSGPHHFVCHICWLLAELDKYENPVALAESSLSSPPPDVCPICGTLDYGCCPAVAIGDPWVCLKHRVRRRDFGEELADMVKAFPTVRQSPSLAESGPESVQPEKQNTADKSELLPTQLPPDK